MKATGLRPRKSPCFSPNVRAGEAQCPSSGDRQEAFPPIPPLVLARPSTDGARPTTLGRATCLTQSTASDGTVTRKRPHRHTQHRAWQMSGYPAAQSEQHIKSTHTAFQSPGVMSSPATCSIQVAAASLHVYWAATESDQEDEPQAGRSVRVDQPGSGGPSPHLCEPHRLSSMGAVDKGRHRWWRAGSR